MSKLVLAGAAGFAALCGLAILPQLSSAAVGPAETTAVKQQPAPAPSYVGFGPGYFAPAFQAGRQATYKTCYMKRSVVFTAEGPRRIETPTCAQ